MQSIKLSVEIHGINNNVSLSEFESTNFMCIFTMWPRTFDSHYPVAKQYKVVVYMRNLTSVLCAHYIAMFTKYSQWDTFIYIGIIQNVSFFIGSSTYLLKNVQKIYKNLGTAK